MVSGADYFRRKKVTVMGLGLLGRGAGDAAYIAEAGAEDIVVTDLKGEAELASSVELLRAHPNVRFVLGEHRMEDFEGRDLIVVAAGVPTDSPYLAHAREAGVRLAQSAALFAELTKLPVIGVTGTRGKSTVTHMIHHVLSTMTHGGKVLLGGNVRGVSNLSLLREATDDSLVVMELDSWQLQGFGWAGISPQIAVFTNFMEDHLNYYKGDMEAYFADKAHIFLHQEESGVFVTTQEVFERAKEFAKGKHITLGQEVRLVDASVLPDDVLLSMPGEHNRLNAALAAEALRATGLTEEEVFEGLATFPGVPGRLENLGEVRGVRVVNDNNATTPQATIAGIRAVARGKNIVLIMGGAYKEVDPAPLIPVIGEHCKSVVFLPGTGTDRIKDQVPATITDSLEGAVKLAFEKAEQGDTLLFSPGFASFGMFKNEYDRNDRFVGIIKSYETA